MKTPDLTPTTRTGQLRCGARTLAADPACDRAAVWHIAWRLAPEGDFSLACDPHMTGLASDCHFVDRHPAEVNCDMPGTGWLTSNPSRCVIAPAIGAEAQQQARQA
ncbi:hypothetical protein [Streptomyces kaempferi]|uniref:Uncharacterized protein n=1 Tax=Streptomyces kaempferi TaxID=333725 RepID=A0ABW3XJG9_9ACTN